MHFIVLGLGLFVVYGLFSQDESDEPYRIAVTRDRLLTFMQYRSKAFDEQHFENLLNTISEKQLEQLVKEYVREEALYREAKALKLDRNDYTARRRLVQKLEYITRNFIGADQNQPQQDLRTYLAKNKDKYYVPSKITFTHVFISNEKYGFDEAKLLAQRKYRELNGKRIPFHLAVSHGDRFLYHTNYVDKEADIIASHFGDVMQEQIFMLDPDDKAWRGPIQSPYGFHLVMVTKKSEGYDPPLEEIRQRVAQDVARSRLAADLEEAIQSIVSNYKVELIDLPYAKDA